MMETLLKNSWLANVWLVARREYLERVRTKGFIIATVLIPAFMGALVFGSTYFATRAKTTSHIAVVSADRTFALDLAHELETGKESQMTVDTPPPTDAERRLLDLQVHDRDGSLAGYLWVTPAANGGRPAFMYKARSAGDISTVATLETAIHKVLLGEGLADRGLGNADIDALNAPVAIDTSATGNTTFAFFTAYLLFFLMYMVIMLYGMNVARSIIEEKTSRVFEVLLSTIKPSQLLAGKMLGVGSVGLTQVGIWMAAAALLSGTAIIGHLAGPHASGSIGFAQVAFFVLYFFFGFLIYSSIAAALGAMTNSEQELQQLNMFLVMPLAFCMVMLLPIIRSPDSTLAKVVSLIPFCSPLLMNFRISLTSVPAWQIWASVAIMSATVVTILWISARIYRVGILMYGKKPNLPEILRWLRYS
jgi:ABC-2 type transport system permease protein